MQPSAQLRLDPRILQWLVMFHIQKEIDVEWEIGQGSN